MAHDAILLSAADFYRRALPADGFPVSPLMICRIQANGDVEVISSVDFYCASIIPQDETSFDVSDAAYARVGEIVLVSKSSESPLNGSDYAKPARYLDATGYKGRK